MPTFMKVSAVVLIEEKPNGFLLEFGMDPTELIYITLYTYKTKQLKIKQHIQQYLSPTISAYHSTFVVDLFW